MRTKLALFLMAAIGVALIAASYLISPNNPQPPPLEVKDSTLTRGTDMLPNDIPSTPPAGQGQQALASPTPGTDQGPETPVDIQALNQVPGYTMVLVEGTPVPQPSIAAGTTFLYDPYGLGLEGVFLGKNEAGQTLMTVINPLPGVSSNQIITLDEANNLALQELIIKVQTGQYQGWVALPAEHSRAPFNPQQVDALQCLGGFRFESFGGGIFGGICAPEQFRDP